MLELPRPTDDGLYIPTVGEWSRDKHYFLLRYIDAFTNAMKDKWSGLHYIDLFAGAGIERLRDSKELDWGSPLIAAQTDLFTKLHLCEMDPKNYDSLSMRIQKFRPDSQVLNGDANQRVYEIIKDIPSDSLSLAFLDPFGLHLDFETLRCLSNKRIDLIVFFPDHLDILRNWKCYYWDNPDSNLDRFLGLGPDWRKRIEDIPPDRYAEEFRKLYEDQIRSLRYTEFEYERIPLSGKPLYRLIFCSQHKIAAKIWRGTSGKKPNGQRHFDFDKSK